jgi:hypothetical protein
MKAYTAVGGAAVAFAFNLTFLPEFLQFNPAAAQLTSLKVDDQEDGVILDLDSAGINACKNFMFAGTKANAVLLRLADGHRKNRNITISGVTSAAGAVDFYCNSDNQGINSYKLGKVAILANNPTEFSKFSALFIPSLAAGDRVIVDFSDGHTQIYERDELEQLAGLYQNVVGYILNNVQSYISRVTVICAAANTAYKLSVLTSGT